MFLEIHVAVSFRGRAKAKMKREAMFLLGNRGETIKRVGAEARRTLMDTFLCDVSLKVHVRAPPLKKTTNQAKAEETKTKT